MRKIMMLGVIALIVFANAVLAQDIPQSQVPSVVVNNFQKTFPKARDVEWELKGELYKVEFETGLLSTDHNAWFDKTGKLVKHKEELSKRDLPKAVQEKIASDFASYRIDDVDKITENEKVVYVVELESTAQDWKVVFDAEGNIIEKIID